MLLMLYIKLLLMFSHLNIQDFSTFSYSKVWQSSLLSSSRVGVTENELYKTEVNRLKKMKQILLVRKKEVVQDSQPITIIYKSFSAINRHYKQFKYQQQGNG